MESQVRAPTWGLDIGLWKDVMDLQQMREVEGVQNEVDCDSHQQEMCIPFLATVTY